MMEKDPRNDVEAVKWFVDHTNQSRREVLSAITDVRGDLNKAMGKMRESTDHKLASVYDEMRRLDEAHQTELRRLDQGHHEKHAAQQLEIEGLKKWQWKAMGALGVVLFVIERVIRYMGK